MNKKQEPLHFAVLATDVALFRLHENELQVLLIPVVSPHYEGMLGLPGGLILPHETAEDSVKRHLEEKAGITKVFVEQLYTFSALERDKRNRVVSVGYIGLVPVARSEVAVKDVEWRSVSAVPALAYDHDEILLTAINRLKSKLGYTTIVRHLLPKEFTFNEFQTTYEIILGRELDKRNFRKKVSSLGILTDTKKIQKGESHRPAALYTWSSDKETVDSIIV